MRRLRFATFAFAASILKTTFCWSRVLFRDRVERALAAIVEPSAYASVNLDNGEMTKYLQVMDEAYGHVAVLPAPPGTVFQSQATLARWLELHYFTLTEALSVVEGHSAARVRAAMTM